MTERKDWPVEQTAVSQTPVLDRAHLARYTMDNPDLEREIIGLFLRQLPESLAMLRGAGSQADWKLAAHTIKGSAAAVGAGEINRLAALLEQRIFNPRDLATQEMIGELERAIALFDRSVRAILA
jgi:HPt (histidine-containing phosphotransfer) domain-containing protein